MKKKKKKQHRSNPKKHKKESIADIPLWTCIVFIVLGGVLGSIFAYDCLYLGKIINREDAIVARGTFDSYEYLYSPKSGAVSEVQINFIDRETLYLDAYHIEMDEKLERLEPGEQLDLLLHPNSEYIWEMTTEDDVILSFDDAKSRTQFENGFFMFFLVGMCLICISMGVFALLAKYFEYKKKIRNKNTASRRDSV